MTTRMPALIAILLPLASAGRGQGRPDSAMAGMDTGDRHAAAAADIAMADPMRREPHMEMTPAWPLAPGDSQRAAEVVAVLRRSLERYRDAAVAVRDGYRPFLPRVAHQRVYHFTNWVNALGARSRFDAARPTSLLYRKDAQGTFVLLGAMYTDAADTPAEELNRRIPLSIAHWHRHVNWCLPPRGAPERWRDATNGRPVFGPRSAIATQAACDAAGGRFVPRLFGWMVHVDAFAGDTPQEIWSDADHAR
jgi:hypothetical protein